MLCKLQSINTFGRTITWHYFLLQYVLFLESVTQVTSRATMLKLPY